MTLAQTLFALTLSIILLGVVLFAVVVLVSATRSGGGPHLSGGVVRRLWRSPQERDEFTRWAYYAHRVTGFAIFAFLLLHIVDVSLYGFSHQLYNQVHQLYGSAPLRFFESGLLFAILFHTFNGIRLLIIDLADLGLPASRRALGSVTTVTALLGAAGSIVILQPLFR